MLFYFYPSEQLAWSLAHTSNYDESSRLLVLHTMPHLNSFNPHSHPKGQKQLLFSFEDEVTATQNGPVASPKVTQPATGFHKGISTPASCSSLVAHDVKLQLERLIALAP